MNITQAVGSFLTPYDYESLTVSTTALGFTATKLSPGTNVAARDLGYARLVLVTIEEASIRYTIHGTDPNSGTKVGHLGEIGDVLSFANFQAMKLFRAVRETATDAKLKITYLR